jgi:hypothetical protein
MAKTQDTTAILKGIYPKVAAALKSNLTKYKNNIAKFMNARHQELYDNGPYTRIYWTADDTTAFYTCLNLKEADIAAELKKTYYANIAAFNPRCAKDPFTCAQLMCIRYFYLNKMNKELDLAIIYLSFSGSFYPSIHYGSFPVAQPQEYRHVMEYVVNNELSQKFYLKKEGSLVGAVKSVAKTWLDTYSGLLKSASDEDCVYLLQQLHNRIKSFMKYIAEIYYEVYDNKDKYLSYNSDNYDEEEFRMADNDSLKAEKYTMAAMNYITTKGVNYKFCKMSADSLVKTDEIKGIIESIQSDRTNIPLIKEFISLSILDYMNKSEDKDVTTVGYLSNTIAAKPNAKDKNILRQIEIITTFLDDNSPAYRKRKNRPETRQSYIRSVMSYYALVVNQANK